MLFRVIICIYIYTCIFKSLKIYTHSQKGTFNSSSEADTSVAFWKLGIRWFIRSQELGILRIVDMVGIQYLLMGKMMLNIDSPSGFWGTYPFVQTNLEKKKHTHMILLWAFKRTVNKFIHRLFAAEKEPAFSVIVTYCNQYSYNN